MIKFRQKHFSEYDAMRSLYVELMKYGDKNRISIIDSSAVIPVLRGNNIVIEKFVISSRVFGKDKYRMYLKIGAKAKLPDDVRLPTKYTRTESVGYNKFEMKNSLFTPEQQKHMDLHKKEAFLNDKESSLKDKESKLAQEKRDFNNSKKNSGNRRQSNYSFTGEEPIKLFAKKNNNNNNNGGGGGSPFITASFSPNINLTYEVKELLGNAISYNKTDRSLVLEFNDIRDAVSALNILPFGIGYKIFLLDA